MNVKEAVDAIASIHVPVSGMLIRLARKLPLNPADLLQIRFMTQSGRALVVACNVDARVSDGAISLVLAPSDGRAVRCLCKLQEKTTELLAACARYPLEEALDKPTSIATVYALTVELCHSLGLEGK